MANSAAFPALLTGKIYPLGSNFQFPEQQFVQYNPKNKGIGLCFSGGGGRAMSAALGQMRGLKSIDTYNYVGAISCVSGGSWFGTIFSYASGKYDDSTLLGPIITPGKITIANAQILNEHCICSPLTEMFNTPVIGNLTALFAEYEADFIPFNRLWSRMLNHFMLTKFDIGDTLSFFSLNTQTVNALLAKNTALTTSNFHILRPNRPYYIAGSTQVYPIGTQNPVRVVPCI